MSYCVKCGVELEQSILACPLCNTPVINPFELKKVGKPTPFPLEKGQVEMVKRKDVGILLSTVLIATSLSCGLLNLFALKSSPWSLVVIGLCLLIWVFFIPAVIYTKLSIYTTLFLDGIMVISYLWMLTFLTHENHWFYGFGIPLVLLITLLLEILAFLLKHIPSSILKTALYVFCELAVLCIGIELLFCYYSKSGLRITWSAVVLTVCSIIVVALITILTTKRLRNAVRRRLHF